MQIQLYDEAGAPILAPDSGELGILWDSLAAIHGEEVENADLLGSRSFSMDEFFKRLYLARAELDICASTLELIGKESDDNVELKAVNCQKEGVSYGKSGFNKASLAKRASISQVVAKFRVKASDLIKTSKTEHEIVTLTLLRLRNQYRWNITRITSHRQITLYFDSAESTPVAAVTISPMLLFRNSGDRFMTGDHLNPINLALIFREHNGSLLLKLQAANDIFSKNLEISTKHESFLLDCRVDKIASDCIESWSSLLKKARFALMVRKIVGLVEREASKNDIVVSESSGFLIAGRQLRFSWTDSFGTSNSVNLKAEFRSWLNNFLNSSGETINF